MWDTDGDFRTKCNLGMVEIEPVEQEDDIAELLEMIELHEQHTGSTVAQRILADWPDVIDQFVKVMPIDYKRVLMQRKEHDEEIETAAHEELHSK